MRIALPLALLSGLTGAFWVLGLPVFFACVIVAVRFYRKHHLGPLDASQGAQLGAVFAFLSSLVFTLFLSGGCALQQGGCRDALGTIVREAINRSPTLESRELLQSLLQSDARLFGFFVLFLFVCLLFMLAMGTVTGALTAKLSRDKPNS